MDTRIGIVNSNGDFECRNCLGDEERYEDEANTVVVSTDDWKADVGACCKCGCLAGDMEAA